MTIYVREIQIGIAAENSSRDARLNRFPVIGLPCHFRGLVFFGLLIS